ncbi:cation transporter [Halodesulfovibrio sp.]|jgi:copper chaperone|uniref:heavy-metal-associated domain-containing protein n=1 Tax=Halodesulfovibrio sp. TaxID=1912772 RepID=UPI0025E38F2C|nr:cation transporter [Halodesulfovibrio sp.]MCT4534330.1 cation transporter [Halodesulfovibrio sp.]MCT4625777.1 cation transporter [Halodesulfovibrio sp.]
MPAITVTGMSCQHCVKAVTTALEAIEGISDVSIDLVSGNVEWKEASPVPTETIENAITGIGFEIKK